MDSRPVTAWTLRPLTIGELLDRAITLTVQSFGVLALIALVYAIPQGLLAFYGTQDQSQFFGDFFDAMRSASAGKHPDLDALLKAQSAAAVFNVWTVLLYVWVSFGLPLYTTAMIYAVSKRYRGLTATTSESYRVTLRSWLTLVGITVVYFVIMITVVGAVTLAGVSIIVAIGLFGSALHNTAVLTVAIVLIAIVATVGTLFFCLAIGMGYVALHFAWMSKLFEGLPLVKAITVSFVRVFGRRSLKRAALFSAAYLLFASGYTLFVLAGVALIGSLFHSNVAAVAFSTLLQVGAAAFFAALFMVFYYDTRVRREGLDLELEVEAVPQRRVPAVA